MEFILELLKNLGIGAAVGTIVALVIKTKMYIRQKQIDEIEDMKGKEENKYKKPTFIEKMLEN